MGGDVHWHHRQTLAAGQVTEFKVWAELVRQSGGALHVFLPLRDMGLDGVLHRLEDGAYMPVQVKGRMSLTPSGQLHITVTASSLVDDDALIVAALVDGPDLGPFVLVVSEAQFRTLAAHDWIDGREYLTAAFELHSGGASRWAPYLVARERLAERFGAWTLSGPETDAAYALEVSRAAEGFLGEAEVIRRLAEVDALALFRPFPDLETVEVLARHVGSRKFLGLQVKTSGFASADYENRVYFRVSSFTPSATTVVCVLGWDRGQRRVADSCLLIPSVDIERLTRLEGEWRVLEFEPGSASHRRLDAYRVEIAELGARVAERIR